MSLVAIIDDRKDVRARLKKRVSRDMSKQGVLWDVMDFDPLPNVDDYARWVVENKVVILIVDELLKERPVNGKYLTYNGHDLVGEIRKYNKQVPIYIITAHVSESDLEEMKGEFEDVISRDDFRKSPEQYVKRFIRATQTYLINFEYEYKRLAELSELVALGSADISDIDELRALQAKMELPLSSFMGRNRLAWLEEIELKADKLEELKNQLEKLLKG